MFNEDHVWEIVDVEKGFFYLKHCDNNTLGIMRRDYPDNPVLSIVKAEKGIIIKDDTIEITNEEINIDAIKYIFLDLHNDKEEAIIREFDLVFVYEDDEYCLTIYFDIDKNLFDGIYLPGQDICSVQLKTDKRKFMIYTDGVCLKFNI